MTINYTQLATALVFAFAVVCVGLAIVDSISRPVEAMPVINNCEVCHANFNITENKTPCQKCRESWSSAF
jgi:Zn finger protein HypA/HybF involved in hydrogenase expression